MGWKVALVLCLGVPTLASGCNIFSLSTRNVVNEPAQGLTEAKLRQRMNAAAREAWKDECARHPPGTYSGAYADGFIQGYVDHLDNGGPPAPPAAPPASYRRHADDFTPAGLSAQKDYLDGFQHGAEAAAATGCRRNFVVPVILPPPKPEQPLNITCLPDPSGPRPPPPADPPPMPKPAPPTAPAALPVESPRLLPLSDAKAALPAAPSEPAAATVAPEPHPAVPPPAAAPEPHPALPPPAAAPDPHPALPSPPTAPDPRPLDAPVEPAGSGECGPGGPMPDSSDSRKRPAAEPALARRS